MPIINSFLAVTYNELIKRISNSKFRIAFAGAGIPAEVARALIEKTSIVECVIIDNSEDVYRIGYGFADALEILRDAGIVLKETHNIRINVLLCDDNAIIYSPNPLLIEDKSKEGFPNGILTSAESVKDIFEVHEISAMQFGKAKGLTQVKETTRQKKENNLKVKIEDSIVPNSDEKSEDDKSNRLVVTNLSKTAIERTIKQVKDNPPKLDLKRQLNTYNAKIKFIEMQLSGFDLKTHKVKIPKELLTIAKNNRDVQNQLSATFTLFNSFNDTSKLAKAVTSVKRDVEDIRTKYMVQLKGYGAMCQVAKIPEINSRIAKIQLEIKKIKENLKNNIQKEIDLSEKELIKLLTPLVKRNPPEDLTDNLFGEKKITTEMAKSYVSDKLKREFINSDAYVSEMKLEVRYKDLSLDTLESEEMMEKIMNSKWKYNFQNESYVTYEKGLAEKKT